MDPGTSLRAAIAHAAPLLRAMTDAHASVAPGQEKWSPKEVIGHLLDSATNNLARIVRLQSTDDLLFELYAQDEWVRAQGYHATDWHELVELWTLYNRHIARTMERVPELARHRPRPVHHALGSLYAPLPADGIPTLDWLMRDYVMHLRHHLVQIAPQLALAGQ